MLRLLFLEAGISRTRQYCFDEVIQGREGQIFSSNLPLYYLL